MIFENFFLKNKTKEKMFGLVKTFYFFFLGGGEDNIIPFYLFNQCLFIVFRRMKHHK